MRCVQTEAMKFTIERTNRKEGKYPTHSIVENDLMLELQLLIKLPQRKQNSSEVIPENCCHPNLFSQGTNTVTSRSPLSNIFLSNKIQKHNISLAFHPRVEAYDLFTLSSRRIARDIRDFSAKNGASVKRFRSTYTKNKSNRPKSGEDRLKIRFLRGNYSVYNLGLIQFFQLRS